MIRPSARPRRGRPGPLAAALLTVTCLTAAPLAAAPAFAQTGPALPALPDGLAAPEGEATDDFRPAPTRVQEDGIDARRFTPMPAAPDAAPSEERSPNGYEYRAPSGQLPAPPPGRMDPRLVPGVGGRPGFDPDDSPVLLGVSGTDTAAGVLVTRVVPGTPADQAGLERGDRVLTVGGQQVGVVATPTGRQVYPLGVELARRLGPTGEAVLLVQDHRTGRITTVAVRPVPRYGPTNPPGYPSPYDAGSGYGTGLGAGGGSIYGPETGFGAGVRPLEPNRFESNPYDRSRFDPYGRDGLPRR